MAWVVVFSSSLFNLLPINRENTIVKMNTFYYYKARDTLNRMGRMVTKRNITHRENDF